MNPHRFNKTPQLQPHKSHFSSIGVIPLKETCFQGLWQKDDSCVELSMRADNPNAKVLYEPSDFGVEGIHRNAFCADDKLDDAYTMGVLADTTTSSKHYP